MSGRGGIYEGPSGELLHGDERPVEYGEIRCCFCKRLNRQQHSPDCVQHGGHECVVGGDCRERPGRIDSSSEASMSPTDTEMLDWLGMLTKVTGRKVFIDGAGWIYLTREAIRAAMHEYREK